MDLNKVKKQALEEIEAENFKRAVDDYKTKLRNKRSVWDVVFPFKIIIIKKERLNGRL